MNEHSCRVCGCTDRFGCPERCYWVEPDLCSVCSGATKRQRRAYTRCTPETEPALMPPLQIFNRVGRLLGYAYAISEAHAMARGIDAYYAALRGLPLGSQLAGGLKFIGAESRAFHENMTMTVRRPRFWQRGPLARRAKVAS